MDNYLLSIIYFSLGKVYANIKEFHKSIKFFWQSIFFLKEFSPKAFGYNSIQINIKTKYSVPYSDVSFFYDLEEKYDLMINIYLNIAESCEKMKEYRMAILYYKDVCNFNPKGVPEASPYNPLFDEYMYNLKFYYYQENIELKCKLYLKMAECSKQLRDRRGEIASYDEILNIDPLVVPSLIDNYKAEALNRKAGVLRK